MKPILAILICFLSFAAIAQTGKPKSAAPGKPQVTCYTEWYAIFKERGGTPVADGTHDVIISLRNAYDYAECFSGKVDVKGEKLAGKLMVQKVDGTYEEFDKKVSKIYQNSEGVLKEELRDISNGMSEALELANGDKIQLFFFNNIAPKPKANKKAPTPSEIVKQ